MTGPVRRPNWGIDPEVGTGPFTLGGSGERPTLGPSRIVRWGADCSWREPAPTMPAAAGPRETAAAGREFTASLHLSIYDWRAFTIQVVSCCGAMRACRGEVVFIGSG